MTSRRPPRRSFNPKREIEAEGLVADLEGLARRVTYGGNPAHKRDPGDFGLTPPSVPRGDKTLCDEAGILKRAEALRLLQEGVRRGLVSVQRRGPFPQNVWAVTEGVTPWRPNSTT